MGIKDVLQKMKLVEVDESGSRSGDNLDDILKKLAPPTLDEQALSSPSATSEAGIPSFQAIFKAAGVTDPGHGYTAYKVLEILAAEGFAHLDAKAKAAALTGFLKMNPSGAVPIRDVVEDAVRRDQALDSYDAFMNKKLVERTQAIQQENDRLQAEIDDLTRRNQELMEANRRTLEREEQKLAQWRALKRVEEEKLFNAVNAFVEVNPISLGGASGGAEPAKKPAP